MAIENLTSTILASRDKLTADIKNVEPQTDSFNRLKELAAVAIEDLTTEDIAEIAEIVAQDESLTTIFDMLVRKILSLPDVIMKMAAATRTQNSAENIKKTVNVLAFKMMMEALLKE